MKRLFWLGLCLLLLSGCSKPSGIVGTWEEEIQVSILGSEQPGEAAAVTRFVFREDGSGSWGTEILDGSHPETVRDFHYRQEEENLVLSFKEGSADTGFSMALSEDTLKMESNRGSFLLKRAKD